MRISDELKGLLDDTTAAAMQRLSLGDLLGVLDRLLRLGAPLVHQSLRPGASPQEIAALATLAGCGGPPPEALLTLFGWHDGQCDDPHRGLTPKNDYNVLLSVEQSRQLLARARGHERFTPGWVPVLARRDAEEDEFAVGLMTQGPHAGSLCPLNSPRSPAYPDLAAFVRALIAKFQDVVRLPKPGQYWVHGVGALLLEANRYHHALPGGLWPIASADCPFTLFRLYWNVRSPALLHDTLADLGHGHTEGATASDALAFELGVASSLAALGRVAGWIDADDAWLMQLRFARTIQRAFASWQEFGEAYVRAWYSRSERGEDATLGRLLADPTSPFQLPWDTPLDRTPTPDPPVEVVALGPDDRAAFNELLGSFRTPRLIELRLGAGCHVLERSIVQPTRIRGTSKQDTVIRGVRAGVDALRARFSGFALEDVTVEHEPGGAPGDADLGSAVTLHGAVLHARRCTFSGTQNGVLVQEDSFAELVHCEIRGAAHTGLSVSGASVVSGGRATGKVYGVCVWEGARCSATALRAVGESTGIRLRGSIAHLVDVEAEGRDADAVVLTGPSRLLAESCRFRSLEDTALSGSNKTAESPPGDALLRSCELGPSDWSLHIGPGLSVRLEQCVLHSDVSAAGGSIVLSRCHLNAQGYASERGFLGIIETPVLSEESPSLQTEENAAIRVFASTISNGIRTEQGGAVRVSRSALSVSSESSVVDVQGGHVALHGCTVTQPHDLHAVVVSGGSLSAVDCALGGQGQVIVGVHGGASAHLWRCRVDSPRADAVLLFNAGTTHVHASTLHSAGHVFDCRDGGVGYADHCVTQSPHDPFVAEEGSAIACDEANPWAGLRRIGPNEVHLDLTQLPGEVRALLDEVGALGRDDGPGGDGRPGGDDQATQPDIAVRLVAAVLGLVAPRLPVNVARTGDVVRVVAEAPIESRVENDLARSFTRPDTALAVLWTIEPDLGSEHATHQAVFSVGMLHLRDDDDGSDDDDSDDDDDDDDDDD